MPTRPGPVNRFQIRLPPSWPGQAAEWLQLPAALVLTLSFARPAGAQAALLSLPWLAVTGLVCLEGLLRIRYRAQDRPGAFLNSLL